MGKKTHHEDKFNFGIKKPSKTNTQKSINNMFINKNKCIETIIAHQEKMLFVKKWNSANENEQINIINILNNLKINKKDKIHWALCIICDLFEIACSFNQIEFVIFVVTNFKDKYYAKIKSNKVIDYTSIQSKRNIDTLENAPCSDWWLKGFNNISKCIECPICFEDTTDNAETKCKHVFCKKCITSHLEIQTICPLCRSSVLCDRRCKNYNDLPKLYGHGFDYWSRIRSLYNWPEQLSFDIETFSEERTFPIRS